MKRLSCALFVLAFFFAAAGRFHHFGQRQLRRRPRPLEGRRGRCGVRRFDKPCRSEFRQFRRRCPQAEEGRLDEDLPELHGPGREAFLYADVSAFGRLQADQPRLQRHVVARPGGIPGFYDGWSLPERTWALLIGGGGYATKYLQPKTNDAGNKQTLTGKIAISRWTLMRYWSSPFRRAKAR